MNARDYRTFRPGCYYHVYNRGNNKQVIFHNHDDYGNFLKRTKVVLGLLQSYTFPNIRLQPVPSDAFTVLAYCLMPNHFHFLIRQNTDVGIDRLLSRVCTSYAKYYNRRYGAVGHLFQDTFKARVVDSDEYLKYLSAYIHNNPENPLDWDYSSLKDYLGIRQGALPSTSLILDYFAQDRELYKSFILAFAKPQEAFIEHLLFEE